MLRVQNIEEYTNINNSKLYNINTARAKMQLQTYMQVLSQAVVKLMSMSKHTKTGLVGYKF